MSTLNLIILAVLIIVGIFLLKFIAKGILKLLVVLVIAGAMAYILYYHSNLFNKADQSFLIYDLQKKYCIEQQDSIKCDCIVSPLLADLAQNYTPAEIDSLLSDPVKHTQLIIKLLSDNKKEIKSCLASRDADYAWDDFIRDLKALEIGKKAVDIFNSLKVDE